MTRPRPNDVRPTPKPIIFFEAEVEANNYEAEASCLLLLTVTARRLLVNIPHKNLENIQVITNFENSKYTSYNNKVSKYQKSYGLRDNTENEVGNS